MGYSLFHSQEFRDPDCIPLVPEGKPMPNPEGVPEAHTQ